MSVRRILLEGLTIQAPIGILEHERDAPQPIIVHAEFDTEITVPARDSHIDSVLDYRLLRAALIDECTRCHTDLLEVLVDNCLTRILGDFPSVRHARIRVSKPEAFKDCVAVSIEQARSR